jgi:hypothetical protein
MTIEREHIDATQGEKVRAQCKALSEAEASIERLHEEGFTDDQITLTTHGGHTAPDGSFIPGGVEVVVIADERADDAERVLARA